ncbi:MAG: recombinase family protein [Hyphomicrobiales bacterium]
MKILPGSTAYSYLRMSTKSQISGDSLRRQTEMSINFAKKHGLLLADENIYSDMGISAFRSKNIETGSLGELLELIKFNKVSKGSYLLIESFDRLSRDKVMVALGGFIDILNAGVNIVTLIDEQVYFADDVEPMQLMVSITIMARAYEESFSKSVRLSASWAEKRKNVGKLKLTRICPAWLDLNTDRTAFIVNKEKAETIKQIYDSAINGQGSNQITKQLNASGTPTISKSKAWSISYITKILKNRAVFGEFQAYKKVNGKRLAQGSPSQGYFPKIVSESDFIIVQSCRTKRQVSGKGRIGDTKANLFTGLIKCGYCKSSMHLTNKGDGPKGGKYLKCSNLVKGINCVMGSWPAPMFEKSFLTYAHKIDFSAILKNRKSDDEISKSEYKLAKIEEEVDKNQITLKKLESALYDPESNVSVLSKRIGINEEAAIALKAQNKQAIAELSALKLKQSDSQSVTALFELLSNTPKDEMLAARIKLADGLKGVVTRIDCFVDGLHNVEQNIDKEVLEEEYFTQWKGNPTFLLTLIDGSEKVVVMDRKNRLQYLFSQTRDEDGTVFQIFNTSAQGYKPNERSLEEYYKNIIESVRTLSIKPSDSGKPILDMSCIPTYAEAADDLNYIGWLITTASQNKDSIFDLTSRQLALYELLLEKSTFSGVLKKPSTYEELKLASKNSLSSPTELIKLTNTNLNRNNKN